MWSQFPKTKGTASGTAKAKTKAQSKLRPCSSRSLDDCVSAAVSGLTPSRSAALDDAPRARFGDSAEAEVAAGLGSDLEHVSSGFGSYLPRGKRREAALRAQLKAQGYAPRSCDGAWDEPESAELRAQSLADIYDAYGDTDAEAAAYDAYGANDGDNDWDAPPTNFKRKAQRAAARPDGRPRRFRRKSLPDLSSGKTMDALLPPESVPREPYVSVRAAPPTQAASLAPNSSEVPAVPLPDPSVAVALTQRAELEDEALRELLGNAYEVATGSRSLLGGELVSEPSVAVAPPQASEPFAGLAGAGALTQPRTPLQDAFVPDSGAASQWGPVSTPLTPSPLGPDGVEDVPWASWGPGPCAPDAEFPPSTETSDYLAAAEAAPWAQVPPPDKEPSMLVPASGRASALAPVGRQRRPVASRSGAAGRWPGRGGGRRQRAPVRRAGDDAAYLKDLDATATVGVVESEERTRAEVKDLDSSVSSFGAPWEQEVLGYSIELDDTGTPTARSARKSGRRRGSSRFAPSSLEDSASSVTLPRGLQTEAALDAAAPERKSQRGRRNLSARRGAPVSSLEDSACFVTLPRGLSPVGTEEAESVGEPELSAAAPAGTKAQAPSRVRTVQ